MQFRTSIHDYEIERLFRRFRHLIGDSHWHQRVKKLEDEIRGNNSLRHHHLQENDIAYALNHCSQLERQYRGLPVGQIDLTPVYPAIAFAAHCLSMLDLMDGTNRPHAIGRIQGAFRNPEDMRALQLEFTVALHFAKRGHRLAWPELTVLIWLSPNGTKYGVPRYLIKITTRRTTGLVSQGFARISAPAFP